MPLDSPLLASVRGGARDGRSPGLATLKEAFDVTYAVHRAEEEGARRRRGGAANGFLQNLNEEDEDEEDTETITRKYGAEVGRAVEDRRQQQASQPAQPVQQPAQQQQYSGAGGADKTMAESQLYHGGRAGPRDQGTAKRRNGGGFDLDMNNATLLGRRHKRTVEPSPLGRFVQHEDQNAGVLDVPGSPMRVD